MPLNNKGIKGLTAKDRELWEKTNAEELKKYNYFDTSKVSEADRQEIFRTQALKGYFNGDAERVAQTKTKSDEYIDSLLKSASATPTKEVYTTKSGMKRTDDREVVGKYRTSSIDLFEDSVDLTELRNRGVDLNRAGQSIKSSYDPNKLLGQKTTELTQAYISVLNNDESYRERAIANIKKIAENISPDYIRYRKTNKLLDTPESFWIEQVAKYQTMVDAGNLDEANKQLIVAIQDEIFRNQSGWERGGNFVAGFVDSVVGTTASGIGTLVGLSYALTGGLIEHAFESDRKTSYLTAVLDDIVDNPLTRWGDSITKYGFAQYWDKEGQRDMELAGIGRYTQTAGSRNATGAQLLGLMQQYGFTAGSMAVGAGEAKLANMIFKGIKAAKVSGKTGEALMAIRPLLDKLKKAEDWVQRWLIPVLVGTSEGAVEGLEVKNEVLREGNKELDSRHQQVANELFQQKLENLRKNLKISTDKETGKITYYDENGNPINLKELYEDAWEESLADSRYIESKQQIEADAATAGTDNFLLNSAINGAINSTLTSTQFAQDVKSKMTRSRLGRYLGGERALQVTGKVGTQSAEAVYENLTPVQKVFALVREPVGEMFEEGEQTLSSAFTKGAAMHDIRTFIENKYDGDGHLQVGEHLTLDNLSAAWAALGEPIENGELAQSMFGGAFTSIVGGIHTIHRGYGNVKTDADGKVIRDKNGKIQYERTLFGKGYKADGTLESTWDVLARMTPWRSGSYTNYRHIKGEDAVYKRREEIITNWLRDPDNVEKFDGLVGSQKWLEELSKAAKTMDEFNVRSAMKGKMINDVMMLEALRGTEQYDAIYNNLSEMALLDLRDAEAVAKLADAYRRQTNDETDTRKDTEIAEQLKSNAKKMIDTMNQVKNQYNAIDRIFGNIDPEAKKAIAFNRVMSEDLKERKNQIKSEVEKLNLSVESTQAADANKVALDDRGKRVISSYGSIENVKKAIEEKNKKIQELEDKIEFLEATVNRTEKQESQLNSFKSQKKRLHEGFKETEDWYNTVVMTTDEDGNTKQVVTDEDIALNEKEIMNLSPTERAVMLARGMGRRYNATHSENPNPGPMAGDKSPYSDAQQKYIENIISTLGQDAVEKIIDLAFIDSAITETENQYSAIISSQEALLSFISDAKLGAQVRYAKAKYGYIKKAKSYEEFVKGMRTLQKEGNQLEISETIKDLASSGNEYYKQYSKDAKKLRDIASFVIHDNKDKLGDMSAISALSSISDYLLGEGIGVNSTTDELINKLYEVGDSGVTGRLIDYVRTINERYGLNISEEKIIELASAYREAALKYAKNSTTAAQVAAPADTPVDTNSSVIVSPAPAMNLEEDTGGNTTQDSKNENNNKDDEVGEQSSDTPEDSSLSSPFNLAYNSIVIRKFKEHALTLARKYVSLLGDNSVVDEVSEYLTKIDTANMTLEEFINKLQADTALGEDGARPNMSELTLAVLHSLITDIQSSQVGENIKREANKEAKKKISTPTTENIPSIPLEQRDSSNLGGGLYHPLENPLMGNKYAQGNPLRNYFTIYSGEDYISDTSLPVSSRGGSDIYFYFDKELDSQLREYLKDSYPAGDFPIVALYKIKKEDAAKNGGKYNAKEINGEFYIPVGILPSNSKSAVANAIRSKVTNTDVSGFVTGANGKSLVSSNRISAPSMENGNTSENDSNLDDIVNQQLSEEISQEELNKINNDSVSEQEQKEIRNKRNRAISKILAKIANRLSIKDANEGKKNKKQHLVLAYNMATGKKDMSSTTPYIFIKEMNEATNFRKQSLEDVYKLGESLENFNEYFKLCTQKIVKTLQEAYTQSEEGKVATIFDADGVKYLHNNISDFFRSSLSDKFTVKVNGNHKLAIYLGDEQLVEFSFNEGKLDLDFKTFYDNLIFPNGKLRENMNFQVDLEGIINLANKGDYNVLFERAYRAGLLRTPMTSLDRPNRTVEITRPQGLEIPKPKNLEDALLGSDLSGTNNTDDRVTTVSGERVNRDTGMTNSGEIPSNPVIDKKKQSDAILLKVKADGDARAAARRIPGKMRRMYGNYVSVTSLIADTKEKDDDNVYLTPSTNIGTTIDTLVRDFFIAFNLSKTVKGEDGQIKDFTVESIKDYFEEHVDENSGESYLRNKNTGTVYYNFTYAELQYFLENSMMKLLDYFRDNHLTIYPQNMGTVGKVTLPNGTVKTVIGEFDLLAQDENGDIHIFDMKTHLWEYDKKAYNSEKYSTALEENSDKWSKQLGYYKMLFESQYLQGTNISVVECGIIPIKVDYPNPKATKYISEDENMNRSSWDENATHRLYTESSNPLNRGEQIDFTQGQASLDLNDKSDPDNPKFKPIHPCSEDMINPTKNTEEFINSEEAQKLGVDNVGDIKIEGENPTIHSESEPQGSRDVSAGVLQSDTQKLIWATLDDEIKLMFMDDWNMSEAEAEEKFNNIATLDDQQNAIACPHTYK